MRWASAAVVWWSLDPQDQDRSDWILVPANSHKQGQAWILARNQPRRALCAALGSRLSALPASAQRGDVLPERMSAAGLLILRDGEPGEPEVTLSPLRYQYQHRAEIEAVEQGATRDAVFDTL